MNSRVKAALQSIIAILPAHDWRLRSECLAQDEGYFPVVANVTIKEAAARSRGSEQHAERC